MGSDQINYPRKVATPTADLLRVKLMLNSVISTLQVQWMTVDIENFYLNTPLERFGYLKLRMTDLPVEVIAYYKLYVKATIDGFVYVKVRKGMYRLPQAGLLVQKLLEKMLNETGFTHNRNSHLDCGLTQVN